MTQTYFRLKTDQHEQDFHIHLYGVFDGSSAFDLLEVIANHADQGQNIHINTDNIVRTYPFGKTILNWNLPKNDLRSKLHFAGTHAQALLPDGCILLSEKNTSAHTCQGNCKDCVCTHE
ncbi:MAG: hypothetical protein QM498_13055 [Desulfobacterium sp.]